MRIGMFIDCDLQRINGVVSSVGTLKQQLEALGHEVFLFVPGDRAMLHEPTPDTFHFLSSQVFFAPEHRFAYPLPLRHLKSMRELKLDLVHLHTPFLLGLLGLRHARAAGLPVVITHHTRWEDTLHYLPVPGIGYLRKVAIALLSLFDNRADVVIAPSESIKALMLSQGVAKPITVLPTGIDPAMFRGGDRAKTRASLGFTAQHKVCLSMGRLGREKSLDFLVQAFAQIAAKEPEAHLVLVGDGPHRGPLEALVEELDLVGRVHFTGYIQRTELRHLLAAADLFVFGSLFETQGLVVIEAMASGLPVVAVDAYGTRDAVVDQQTGYLTPQQVEPFAARAVEVLSNEVLHKRFSQAAALRAERFLSANMATNTLAVYERAAKQPPRPADPLKLGA